jgi:hypothetical protein
VGGTTLLSLRLWRRSSLPFSKSLSLGALSWSWPPSCCLWQCPMRLRTAIARCCREKQTSLVARAMNCILRIRARRRLPQTKSQRRPRSARGGCVQVGIDSFAGIEDRKILKSPPAFLVYPLMAMSQGQAGAKTFEYVDVHNETSRFAPARRTEPCTVICLGCPRAGEIRPIRLL